MHSVTEEVRVQVYQDVARQARRNVKVAVLAQVRGYILHRMWVQSWNQVGIWVMISWMKDVWRLVG